MRGTHLHESAIWSNIKSNTTWHCFTEISLGTSLIVNLEIILQFSCWYRLSWCCQEIVFPHSTILISTNKILYVNKKQDKPWTCLLSQNCLRAKTGIVQFFSLSEAKLGLIQDCINYCCVLLQDFACVTWK